MNNLKLFLILFLLSVSNNLYANCSLQQQERNKKTVLQFYQKAINDKNYDTASYYLGDKYIQHNPNAKDGKNGLQAYIQFLKANYPHAKSEIKRIFTDGDYVILQVHAVREPGKRGNAIFDLFRLENGKIVEHWDVAQSIPQSPLNLKGMF